MTWVKLDDSVNHHPKIRRAGGEAAWLWTCGIAHCNKFCTDGRIQESDLGVLYPGVWGPRKLRRLAEKLVEVELWVAVEGGWMVHDYADFQAEAMSAAVEERRRLARERQARSRSGANAEPSPNGDHAAIAPGSNGDQKNSASENPRNGPKSPEKVPLSQCDTSVSHAPPGPDPARSDLKHKHAREPELESGPLSDNEQAVLVELRRHPSLASVAKPELARAWWLAGFGAKRGLPQIRAAIAWVASQAATAAADGTPKTHEDIRDHLAALVVTWKGDRDEGGARPQPPPRDPSKPIQARFGPAQKPGNVLDFSKRPLVQKPA